MTIFVDIKKMSTRGLKAMQLAIRDLLIKEDNQSASEAKVYGLREFSDWKTQADEMEAELDARGEVFTKISW